MAAVELEMMMMTFVADDDIVMISSCDLVMRDIMLCDIMV
jgi:hypothetical protein